MILHDVEQRSPEWYAIRLGVPTASEFSKLITSKGAPSKSAEPYALKLAAEVYAGKPVDTFEGTAWTERGRELEDQALAYYEFMTDEPVLQVGFATDDHNLSGCSPDGLVGDDGMVEIKCLKAENHIKTILYHQKHDRCPPDYVQQTQGQLMVCERSWCDLVFYHPDLPHLTIRQTPDAAIQSALRIALAQVVKRRDEVVSTLQGQNQTKAAA